MRDPVVALYVFLCLVVVGSTVVARRRFGAAYAFVACWCTSLIACLAVVAQPAYSAWFPSLLSGWQFTAAAVALSAAAGGVFLATDATGAATRAERLGMASRFQRWTLVLMAIVLPVAAIEGLAFTAVKQHWLWPYVPMETRVALETEDWRFRYITQDDLREPDPVLLWRPAARAPYNEQRFRGRLATTPKDPSIVRIFTYGDSNTDGPADAEGWPDELDRLLNAGVADGRRRYEVFNAGVAGYSSYQGLRRYQGEVDRYQPDIVLVSFGWNDAANGVGHPDHELLGHLGSGVTDAFWISIRRVLFKYSAFLVAARYLAPSQQVETKTLVPRVDLDDYAHNLVAFAETARRTNGRVVLLTRPHREAPEALRDDVTWRRRVPDYNDRLRAVAVESGLPALDVESTFRDHPEAFVDECHFTGEGHRQMAVLVRDFFAREGLIAPRQSSKP